MHLIEQVFEQSGMAARSVRRFTVDEYIRMGEAGVFDDCERVELIDGVVFTMSPFGPPHPSVVDRLTRLLILALQTRAIVRVQGPLKVSEHTMPEPDVLVLREEPAFYASRHAGVPDTMLGIEVSESSLNYDRGFKARLYAGSGMQEYWVVDLVHDEILIHTDARPEGFASIHNVHRGDTVRPLAFPDVELQVTDILGPATSE
jgi:Uma2 family endonuclease